MNRSLSYSSAQVHYVHLLFSKPGFTSWDKAWIRCRHDPTKFGPQICVKLQRYGHVNLYLYHLPPPSPFSYQLLSGVTKNLSKTIKHTHKASRNKPAIYRPVKHEKDLSGFLLQCFMYKGTSYQLGLCSSYNAVEDSLYAGENETVSKLHVYQNTSS